MSGGGPDPVEFEDVQGLVRFGHGHLAQTGFDLLRVADVEAARAWLRANPPNNALPSDPRPQRVLQVAFTAAGLRALQLDETVLAGFSDEFLAGMSGDPNRSLRLGDTGSNDPRHWRWGGPGGEPHVALLLYAADVDDLAAWRQELADAGFARAFALMASLDATLGSDREPFGFVDGISQPAVDWAGTWTGGSHGREHYDNRLAAGEVLLGYPNEYGLYTNRPLLDPGRWPPAQVLPEAADRPALRDLGRNGSYLVIRQLAQDVPGFWQYLDRASEGDPERREALASAMVGRGRDGSPLVPSDGLNDFDYDDDPLGRRCPLGAHVRRANPRSGDFPAGTRGTLRRLLRILGFGRIHAHDDLVASARFHRLLRRGRVYGDDLATERGLHFACIGANISRQFEFVQNAWMASAKFAGLERESDPLLGNREPLPDGTATDSFSRPREDAPAERVEGLPQFVQVQGGAYFFLPGLRALRFIAGDPG